MPIKKLRYHLVGLNRFRQREVGPKGTRQSVKPNQLSIHPSLYKGTMQIYCPAQEQIAHTGQEKCRRHASQVSELRGQHRIRRICYPRPDFRLELKR